MSMGLIYQKEYQVPFYETDINQNIKLPHLLSLALHISGLQSYSIGMSDERIFKEYNLVWIVTNYQIEIERLPKYAENIIIETEAVAYNKLFCYRDFIIYGEDGKAIMTIHCTFVLMDYDSRKARPISDDLVSVFEAKKVKKVQRGAKYENLENPEETRYHVRFFDLDLNGHVNNSKYLEWMYEVLDLDFLRQYIPKKIELKYVKEVHYGYDIQSCVEVKGLVTKHEIVADGMVHAQAYIEWQKNGDIRENEKNEL